MIATEVTTKLSLIPEENKVIISQLKYGENDLIIITGKDWRKGEFHRVYITAHYSTRNVELGYYTLMDPRYEQMDLKLDYTPFTYEGMEFMKKNMTAIIGALRGIA